LIGEFERDRQGKRLLPYEQKCELLAKLHEEFGRVDMASERRREAKCVGLSQLTALHLLYDEVYWPTQPETPPPHEDSDAPPERHRGADRA